MADTTDFLQNIKDGSIFDVGELNHKIILDAIRNDDKCDHSLSDPMERDEEAQNEKITEFVLKHAKKSSSENSKIRRNRYSDADLRKVLEMVDKIQDEAVVRSGKKLPIKKIVDYFRTQTIYRTLSESMITRWTRRLSNPTVHKKRGRKVNEQFENDVIDDLLKSVSSNSFGDASALQMNSSGSNNSDGSNGDFDFTKVSYDAVRLAAARVRSSGDYQNDKAVANLQFTNKWVDGIKRRFVKRSQDLMLANYGDDSMNLDHSVSEGEGHADGGDGDELGGDGRGDGGMEAPVVDGGLLYSSELVAPEIEGFEANEHDIC